MFDVSSLSPQNTNHHFLLLTAFTDLLHLVCSVNRPFNDSERNSRLVYYHTKTPLTSSSSAAKLLLQLRLAEAAAQRPSNRFHLWQMVWFCRTSTTRMYRCTACSPGLLHLQTHFLEDYEPHAFALQSDCFYLKPNSEFAVKHIQTQGGKGGKP